MVRYEHNGKTTVLADKWQGKPLNAPNDIVVHPDGGIWFTDPGYGILGNYEGNDGTAGNQRGGVPDRRQDRQDGRWSPTKLYKPNGLCFSPDYKKLYICDTGATHYPDAPKNHQGLRRRGREELRNGKAVRLDGIAGQGRGHGRRHPRR